MIFTDRTNKEQMPMLCRQRLLSYADSFSELAKSFDGGFPEEKEDRRSVLEEHKLWENRQVICTNLNEMSRIMTQMAGELLSYEPLEEKSCRRIFKALKGEGVYMEGAYLMPGAESRKILVLGLRCIKEEVSGEYVAQILSVLLERRLRLAVNSPGRIFAYRQLFLFSEEPKYMALTGFARATREQEDISGDNYSVLESEKGKLTILLSDGTGSGEKACRDSGLVLDLMEKLLETGYEPTGAVNLVNLSLFAREDQISHPTLDFCELDLYQGICKFYKVGGATSFLRHAGKTKILSGGNLPLGFFQNAELKQDTERIKDGDYVVLVTDGILDAMGEEDPEAVFCRELDATKRVNPGEMAEEFLQKVLYRCGGHVRDDMTIMVVGIWENSQIQE